MPSNSDDSGDDTSPDEVHGTVLSPDELDIREDQHVIELDDGRYVISADEPPSGASRETEIDAEVAESPKPVDSSIGDDAVHGQLAERLKSADSRYGFDITAVFEGQVVHQELFSNDVITTFENLLVWYAQHVGGDTPVEDVLGILLAESTAPIRLPPNALDPIIDAIGVEPEDSVADLLEVVRRDGGLQFPSSGSTD